jgi:hypothetical protein
LVPDPDMEGTNDKEDDSSDSTSSDYEEEELFDVSTDKGSMPSNNFSKTVRVYLYKFWIFRIERRGKFFKVMFHMQIDA